MTINNLIVTFVFIFNNVNIIHFNLETKNTDIGITVCSLHWLVIIQIKESGSLRVAETDKHDYCTNEAYSSIVTRR